MLSVVVTEVYDDYILVVDIGDINHIKNVFRKVKGDKIRAVDGANEYLCEIEKIDEKEIKLKILEKIKDSFSLDIEIDAGISILKGDKMDLTIQKLTELGINKIIPISVKRCVVKLDKKKDRWDIISKEALKQCQGVVPTVIDEIKKIDKLNFKDYDLILVPYENEKKIFITFVIIVLLLFIIVFLVLPRLDFMYVHPGKHWLKEKIADQDNNTGAKTILKVEQGENGEYFVYENRLLYIDNKEGKVSEICEISEQILGILIKGDAIFLREDNSPYIYKITQDGIKTKLIDNDGATYMEGKHIYELIDARLEKYDLNGKKIFSIDTEYDNISCNSLFDEYIFFKEYDEIGLSAPRYYLFDINKIKYITYTLDLSRYYQFPVEWDLYSEKK